MSVIRRGHQSIEVVAHGRTHRFHVEVAYMDDGAVVVECPRISEVVRGSSLSEAMQRMTEIAGEHVERSWRQAAVKGA